MAEVLPIHLPEGQSYFSPSPLRQSSSAQAFLMGSPPYSASRRDRSTIDRSEITTGSISSSAPSSPVTSHIDLCNDSSGSSIRSTPASSLSLNTSFEDDDDDDDDSEDDTITFPSYRKALKSKGQQDEALTSPKTQSPPDPVLSASPDPLPLADDTAIRPEPSHHVDYLSYDWREEDIWSSWRHIVSKRKIYGERSRLENASWRTWAKSKYKLKTVSPETLNWLKDHDVTWLYGPLQPASNRSLSHQSSEPASYLSRNTSFLNKKPILKKRSVSELMLQKSISASSLLKQAAAAVQAQQQTGAGSRMKRRPVVTRASSDFISIPSRTISRDTAYSSYSSHTTSGLQTPDNGEKRHIRFDDNVEQCIAVEVKDSEDYDEEEDWALQDDSSSDEGVVMMKSSKRKPLSRSNSRSSFSGESKTIAKLPSTTLKYRTDSPDIPDSATAPAHSLGMFRSSTLSPSPSQETLRPSNPATNFLLAEEDDDDDISWEPSGAFADRTDSVASSSEQRSMPDEESGDGSGGLRRTESGMFMPYEDDDDEMAPPGIFGRVVDTVNTAKDIAHVIWNVGWRK